MLSPERTSMQRQRGLSLVEMMVGIAVGLFVVAAAAMMTSAQLVENRRLLVATQVQQDLRAASDIVTRELRRAGAWGDAKTGVWYRGVINVACNGYATVSTPSGAEVDYRYYRGSGSDGPLGFKLDGGVLKYALTTSSPPAGGTCEPPNNPGNWQELTDARTVRVTAFTVTPQTGGHEAALRERGELIDAPAFKLPCAKECVGGGTACWPTVAVRELVVEITGEAVSDPTVRRNVRSTVRVRNDRVRFNDAANPTQLCPL